MSNRNRDQLLTADQHSLVSELTDIYGIEPDEITFFTGDPKPFFSYEATCVLCNELTDIRDINIEPVETHFEDSLSLKCTVTDAQGRTRSAVGVVNVNVTGGDDGRPLSEQQLYQLASARAIRNALKTAGVDLFKLHLARHLIGRDRPATVPAKSNQASLLAQAHALGREAGLIRRGVDGDDKSRWYDALYYRYGVSHSNELDESALADFVAYLRAAVPAKHGAAA